MFSKIPEIIYIYNKKIENIPLLVAIRSGLTYMIPLVLIGSVALLLSSLPLPAYQNMMENIFGDGWKDGFRYVQDGTFNILSLLMAVCISYSLAIETNGKKDYVSPIIVSLVALSSFMTISGISNEGFSIAKFGAIGIFTAMLTSIISSSLFIKLSSFNILRIKVFTDGAGSLFNNAMSAIIPAIITVGIFAGLNVIIVDYFKVSDIQQLLSIFLRSFFLQTNSNLANGVLFVFLIHVLWSLGIHGSNVLESVAQAIFVPALAENASLIMSGQNPTMIITKTFVDTFVFMGGCGTSLCLVAAIFIAGKYKNQKHLARLSLLPVLFNINELIMFGIPIVLNPVYLIPFLFVPIVLTLFSYLCISLGLVPYTYHAVEWTTPIFLSGYISTQSINGSILQLFNLILGTLCYIPFVRIAENISDSRMEKNLKKVYDLFKQYEERGMVLSLISRQDDIGGISRFLTASLDEDLRNGKISLYYQPQISYEGKVTGVEALLRWKNNSNDYIYPPLIIALADEARLIDKLGNWILETACRNLKEMNNSGISDMTVSVNVSAAQFDNIHFAESLKEIIDRYEITPGNLKIEITEQLTLSNGSKIVDQITSIKKLGVRLAMDDFGMGHSSLTYLREYDFDTIKLDGSLVRDISSKNSCRNIISSIVSLGKSLNYSVVAEYVENEEQRNILHELGCDNYQGYLYSKPLPCDEVIDYILEMNSEDTSLC